MRRLYRHEVALGGFAGGSWLALLSHGQAMHPASLWLLAASGVFTAAVVGCARARWRFAAKLRLGLAYVFALFLYQSVRTLVPAMHLVPADDSLLALDRALFGSAPAGWLTPQPALTELFSGAYLSYQPYLHLTLAHALLRPLDEAERLYERVFTVMGVGFCGYLLMPATGPRAAFAEFAVMFEGGPLTALNAWVVNHGSSVFDAFPSLHIAVTATLLAHDAVWVRRRFLVMMPVAILLAVSTLYLRYHYAVDLLAGAALAAAVILTVRFRSTELPAQQPIVEAGEQPNAEIETRGDLG